MRRYALWIWIVLISQLMSGGKSVASESQRKKVADGEYVMLREETYPSFTKIVEIRESWSLWELGDDGYEIDSLWVVNSPQETFRTKTWIELSPGFHPTQTRGLGTIRETDLTCRFGEREVRCRTGNEEPRISVDMPYDLYLSVPWFVSSILRRPGVDHNRPMPVKLLIMDRGGPKSELGFGEFEGQVRYLGEESITAAGREFWSRKYELKADPFPGWLVWLSPDGIALAMQAIGEKTKIELERYEKHRM